MHVSSSTTLNLKSSFLVIIILCSYLNENCLNLFIFSPICEIIGEVVFPVSNTSRLGDAVSTENFVVVLQRISVKSNVKSGLAITEEDNLAVSNNS